jgi:hypothetical protein
MTFLNDEVLRDFELARNVITQEDCSLVVIKYGKIWKKAKETGVKPVLDAINEMDEDIHGSVIGEKILGKASALLCRFAKASGVYSPRGTKTAIALLIMGGVPCQIDRMIPSIDRFENSGLFQAESMLNNVKSPEEAYLILKEKIL